MIRIRSLCLVLLSILAIRLTSGSVSSRFFGRNIERAPPTTTAAAAAAAAATTTDFIVKPPFGARFFFPLLEEGRILFLKLFTSTRSVNIETSVGKTHAFICPGKGTLPPVVLIHGVCSTSHDYLPLIIRLQKICSSVIVVDLPGHGRSEICGQGEPDDSWLVLSVVEVIRQLVKDKAILFGNSLGGLVAIRTALLIPDKIVAMVLASPAGAPVSSKELEGLKSFFRLSTHQCGVKFLSRVTAYPEKIPRLLMSIMSWTCRVRVSSPSIKIIMTSATPSHMLQAREIRRIRPPTMLIWGKYERILPASGLAFFKKNMKQKKQQVEFHEEEEFGHVPFLDDPSRLVDIMQGFFTRIGLYADGSDVSSVLPSTKPPAAG